MTYLSIVVEGGLFPADLLDRIAAGDVEGQRPTDFAVEGTQPIGRLSDEIGSALSDGRAYWDVLQRRLARSTTGATTLTREAWIVPLLERLGFNPTYQPNAAVLGEESYAISHRADREPDAPPVHVVGLDQSLDHRERGRRSPHGLVQEYLNRSDALWGIVTNGRKLRLLRDLARVARPTYLEVDLEAIVRENRYSEFVLVYRLLHRSRFPGGTADAPGCLLEKYYQRGIEEGGRVRDGLRDGVEKALIELGTAFLAHPASAELRTALAPGGGLDAPGYYRQLLRLIYRILFLLVVEERRLVFPPEGDVGRQQLFTRYYSLARLRERCERFFAGDRNDDLWAGAIQTFQIFRYDDIAIRFGLRALDGELFGDRACADLERASCANEGLLRAIHSLSTFVDGAIRRRVNYAALDVEELGSVYESLLEFRPHVELGATPRFELLGGSERKQTGSYYTPPGLVRVLVERALVPVIDDRLTKAKSPSEKETALLGLRVCDPASGSGHFLLEAARRIARELAKVRTGEAEPTPEAYRAAARDVIRSCIYAVDKNPLAVDLCKVALRLEGYNAGLPLNFLDHHVRRGDSLVGVMDLDVLAKGIPDEAYAPVAGDDKTAATHFKKRNRSELAGQMSLFEADGTSELSAQVASDFGVLAALDDRTPADVRAKEELYAVLRGAPGVYNLETACDLWTSAFFLPLRLGLGGKDDTVPTSDAVRQTLAQNRSLSNVPGSLVGAARGLAYEHPFFHWPLEFPEVFRGAGDGFDVVLGNPPWERIKLQEEEFFAGLHPAIARAPNKAARQKLIDELPRTNPALAQLFSAAKHAAEAQSKFIRFGGRFLLCGHGDINTYSVFAETMRALLGPTGRAGFIVPTGIATDDTNKQFFQSVVDARSLAALYDFENRQDLFPAVDSRMKFALVVLSGRERPVDGGAEFAFFLHQVHDLRDPERRFVLTPDDFALLNPNTRTCPIFRTRRDAEITKGIYRRVPVLIKERPTEESPWGVSFLRMIDPYGGGWKLLAAPTEVNDSIPIYEGKMFDQFDHRLADVVVNHVNIRRPAQPRLIEDSSKSDPWLRVTPQYWVSRSSVTEALTANGWDSAWLLVQKKVTSTTNERTQIATVLPLSGTTESIHCLIVRNEMARPHSAELLANLNSVPFDYVCRQKLGGDNFNYFVLRQLAMVPPSVYEDPTPWANLIPLSRWLSSRVLELIYTAWDLEPFASSSAWDGAPFRWDEERRFLIRCELDAAYFHLYGIQRDDADYIMETFPIVKRKDEARYAGEYRTKTVILQVYDAMRRAMDRGGTYETILDPPPGDPRAAHGG